LALGLSCTLTRTNSSEFTDATGLLPGIVLLPAGAALTFAGAAVLVAGGVPQQQAGLAFSLLAVLAALLFSHDQ
jgi:hypothetical protein